MVAHACSPDSGGSGKRTPGGQEFEPSVANTARPHLKKTKNPTCTLYLSKGWCHFVYSMKKNNYTGIKVYRACQPLMSHSV